MNSSFTMFAIKCNEKHIDKMVYQQKIQKSKIHDLLKLTRNTSLYCLQHNSQFSKTHIQKGFYKTWLYF